MKKPSMRDLAAHMRFEDDAQISEFIDMSPREGARSLRENPAIAGEMVLCREAETILSADSEASPDYLALVRRALDATSFQPPVQKSLRTMATDAGVTLTDIARALDVSLAIVNLFNLRSIDIATVPDRFFAALADAVSETVHNVRFAVSGAPIPSAQMMYLSPDKPTSGDLINFMEELEMDPDIPDAGRLRWEDPAHAVE